MFLHFISKWCFALINVVRENFSAPIVALSIVLGMYFGLTPVLSLQSFFLALVATLIHTNVPMMIVSTLFFSLAGLVLEPLFDAVGSLILTQTPWMLPFWSWMYHAPVLPYTQFNQTVVMGSTVVTLVFCLPAYIGFKKFFTKYSERMDAALTGSRFYRSISHYERIYG